MDKVSIIKKLLFTIIDSLSQDVFSFEKHLRMLKFKYKIDPSTLRNECGFNLLHAIVFNNKMKFAAAIFRCGCWKDMYLARILSDGTNNNYFEFTPDELCTQLRYIKLQMELDLYTQWDKSLNVSHIYARAGSLHDLQRMMEFSTDTQNELDYMNCTSLYWGVVGGNEDVVTFLLEKGVNPSLINKYQETLLHICCTLGHSHLIEMLFQKLQMDILINDINGQNVLMKVAETGNVNTLKALIKCGVRKELLDQTLPIAGHNGRLDYIQTIIEEYGADPHSKDENSRTAILNAASQGKLKVLKYLLSKNGNLMDKDNQDRNVLHLISHSCYDIETMQLVLDTLRNNNELKKLIDAKDKYIGRELCVLAKTQNSWSYIEVRRHLYYICMKKIINNYNIDLLQYGTVFMTGLNTDFNDSTVKDMEKRFTIRENIPTTPEDLDSTPLYIAVFRNNFDMVKLLLEYGGSVNIHDKFGLTALHIAAMHGYLNMCEYLINNGANIDELDSAGKTASDVAEDNEHINIANYIRGIKYLPIAERFNENISQGIQSSLSLDKLQKLRRSEQDVRKYIIDQLRDLIIDVNITLQNLGVGPVLECTDM